jgi:hypothetical protein
VALMPVRADLIVLNYTDYKNKDTSRITKNILPSFTTTKVKLSL